MRKKLQKLLWRINHLRPSQVRHLFTSMHTYANDPSTEGMRRAILFGRLYFLHDSYTNGQYDKKRRAKAVDAIIHEYTHPTSAIEYIKLLNKTIRGVEEANAQGFIITPNPTKLVPDATSPNGYRVVTDREYKKKEAGYYEQAIDSLNLMIRATIIYPRLWKRIFLAPC